MEKNPWWKNVEGPFPIWQGPVGVKEDGGGCTRGRGRVGKMVIHRAVCNMDKEAIVKAADNGEDVNEVEAAGNTPLHSAAFFGWIEGAELLLNLGAKINSSNNAGDRPWHWAENAGQKEMMEFLEQNGASKEQGLVLVQEHVPKVKVSTSAHVFRKVLISAVPKQQGLSTGKSILLFESSSLQGQERSVFL